MAREAFEIDLSDYIDSRGSLVPEGEYTVRVRNASMVEAKSGNTMVVMNLEILTGAFKGEVIVDRLVLTQASMFRVVDFLKAAGIATPRAKFSIQFRDFVGKTVLATTIVDEFNGQKKTSVSFYSPTAVPAGEPKQPAAPSEPITTEAAAEPVNVPDDASSLTVNEDDINL
jgi:Protein of unknown function (DUF669)